MRRVLAAENLVEQIKLLGDGAFWVADKTRTGSPFSQNSLPPHDMRDFLDRFY
jgi:hypothetical protein